MFKPPNKNDEVNENIETCRCCRTENVLDYLFIGNNESCCVCVVHAIVADDISIFRIRFVRRTFVQATSLSWFVLEPTIYNIPTRITIRNCAMRCCAVWDRGKGLVFTHHVRLTRICAAHYHIACRPSVNQTHTHRTQTPTDKYLVKHRTWMTKQTRNISRSFQKCNNNKTI